MTFYPFKNPETGEESGSFETLFISKDDYMWTDENTCWFEIMCDYIDMEGGGNEVKSILGKVGEAMTEGYDEDFFLDEDEKEIYERIQKAPELLAGWYWRASFPGCLPDSDPFGPFKTEKEAIENTNE